MHAFKRHKLKLLTLNFTHFIDFKTKHENDEQIIMKLDK